MTERLRELLEESGAAKFVNSGTYRGSTGWPYVALVGLFVAAYVLLAVMGIAIPAELAAVAGWVLGTAGARTYKRGAGIVERLFREGK